MLPDSWAFEFDLSFSILGADWVTEVLARGGTSSFMGVDRINSSKFRLGFKAGVTKLLPQTQSCFLVQIHAKFYQVDTHTSENKNLHVLSSYDVIIKNKN